MTVLGRQAVVVVHGIGEQAPLATVREFVGRRTAVSTGQERRGGVVGADDRVFAEPSPVASRSDELIYAVTWNQSAAAADLRQREAGWRVQERAAVTDFHEFYWAPRYRSTSLGHVTGWVLPLMLRRLRTFSSPRLVGPRGAVRAVPAVVLLAALGVCGWVRSSELPVWVAVAAIGSACVAAVLTGTFLGLIATLKVVALCVVATVAGSVIVWGFGAVVENLTALSVSAAAVAVGAVVATAVTRTLGDAARYLAGTSPENVDENEAIRERVLDLLERLHDTLDPDTGRYRYDRIVVVGHSLGSVIAYDAVRLLWARWSRRLELPAGVVGPTCEVIVAVERAGETLRSAAVKVEAIRAERAPLGLAPVGEKRAEAERLERERKAAVDAVASARAAFIDAQRAAQLVLRDLSAVEGSRRWVVTDLITLGCPLTYADAFMASSPQDLADRFEERSLASSPPMPQQVRRAAAHPYRLWIPGADGGSTRWHHAAPFACVTWTNAWFEHDIVGGPVAPHFGPGVRDMSLGGTRWLAGMAYAYPHSSYWVASHRPLVKAGSETCRAMLREVITRRPTLLLTGRAPLTDGQIAAVCDLLAPFSANTSANTSVDVRLYVGATDSERRGAYLPLGTVGLPPADVRVRLAAILGPGSRLSLLASPDLLDAPSEEGEPETELDVIGRALRPVGDREVEPVGAEEADVVGEEAEPDEAVGEEAEPDEVVGEEE